MPSQTETAIAVSPQATLERLLWERCRVAGKFALVAIFACLVGELVLHQGQRPAISFVQALNFAVIAACLRFGGDPTRRRLNGALCLIGFSATAVAIGAVGIIAEDSATTLVVLVGLSMGIAILVPWGASYQLPSAAVCTGVAIWNLASIQPESGAQWLQTVGSIAPSFALSVVVAHLLQRQGLAVAEAERERLARERGLFDANRRLAMEIHDHEKTEESLRFALLELDHRVKNTLTALQSIAEQTLQTSTSAEEFMESFRGRIRAMARIHSALAAHRWEKLDLSELVDFVVGPYRLHPESVSLCDVGVSLSSDEARSLGTALHELATNAAKYGALSTREGRVRINATVSGTSARRLHLSWREQSGPPVGKRERHGLGTKLIEVALAYELGGEARLDFDASGVGCEIDMPLGAAPRSDP